jgi:hypothetical protein
LLLATAIKTRLIIARMVIGNPKGHRGIDANIPEVISQLIPNSANGNRRFFTANMPAVKPKAKAKIPNIPLNR